MAKLKLKAVQNLVPLQRLMLGLIIAAIVYYFSRHLPVYLTALITWNSFALSYLLVNWFLILSLPLTHLKRKAATEDGTTGFVFAMVLLFSAAGLLIVLLMLKADITSINKMVLTLLAIMGSMLSWALVHTFFTFHYAHLYYSPKSKKELDFPGDEEPDYLDFAYFSFVIGCTFQVSDVEITGKKFRRLVLLHGLLAFLLNTFVIALCISIISNLIK